MTSLDDLLVLQQLDTRVDQTRHRRLTLAQRGLLVAAREELATVAGLLEGVESQLRAVRSTQKEAEDHAAILSDKAVAVNASLYDGSVTSPKELEALQAEITQLRNQQNDFEEQALEQMEIVESLTGEVARHRGSLALVEDRISDLEEQILVAETEMDVQLDELAVERSSAAEGIPGELLELYTTLRNLPGGVAIASIEGNRCGGCHLEIPSAELEQIRRATDLRASVCPECGCLLAP